MKTFFYIITTVALVCGYAPQAQAQDNNSKGSIIINGTELDIDNFVESIEDAATEFAEAIENGAIKGNVYINGKRIGGKDSDKSQQRFRGSGRIITEKRTVPADYRGIVTSRSIKVTLEDRLDPTAIIRADDNVMPYIKIEDRNGVLEIKIDDEIRTINNVTAEVSLPKSEAISLLEAASASHINVNYTIKSSSLEIDAASAAEINISKADVGSCDVEVSSAANIRGSIIATSCEVEASSAANARLQILAGKCEADASSAAKIILSGEAGTLSADASSAADINAVNLKILNNGIANSSSGADIKIQAGKSLSANASSGGTVHYKSENDLNIHIKKSSGGSVRKM